MASVKLASLPALRKQHLLAEFAGLKQACPNGIFVSLTPGDSTLWSGVIFVRKGPYAPAILRFQISFPDTYPQLPPLVTFWSDMFHPLITPLNTYTYTTDIQDAGTVSAHDEERLPPGGFSLRHGFPEWFSRSGALGRPGRQAATTTSRDRAVAQTPPRGPPVASNLTTPDSKASPAGSEASARHLSTARRDVSTYEVLSYIRSTFDDEGVLDAIPLECAGNPGAWHAWRTRQRGRGRTLPLRGGTGTPSRDGDDVMAWHDGLGDAEGKRLPPTPAQGTRRPGEWNWEGVWEDRVQKGIAASLSDAVLYGGAGAADDVIRFLEMDAADVEGVKDNLLRTLGSATARSS